MLGQGRHESLLSYPEQSQEEVLFRWPHALYPNNFQDLAHPLTTVTLRKLLDFSVPQLLHLQNGLL